MTGFQLRIANGEFPTVEFPTMSLPFQRYKPYPTVDFPQRQWPNRAITKAPIWCSVDLRDGNQALVNPMTVEQKLIFFDLLVELGFKEIEVGFPAASTIEFEFIRSLIEENRIPADVSIQVLTQARPELIDKTVEALQGANKVIFHLYNSVSSLQRKVVFKTDRSGVKKIALDGTHYVKEACKRLKVGRLTLEYSPESFTGTELDFSLEVCEAVADIWQPSKQQPMIINLPATVEMSTPNVYADRIEWMSNHFLQRETIVLSVHPHNDRGTAVAAAELALLAGADRIEGTLFGNGERTGNVDLVVLALNLYSQGIDPKLDMSSIETMVEAYKKMTEMEVHARHPYAGELVYTAFSGSHQDAIKKGMDHLKAENSIHWEVPYLPIDPTDLGREYEPVRINSQSGKGGIAYVLEYHFGYKLPKSFQPELSKLIQKISETTGKEVGREVIFQVFRDAYVNLQTPLAFQHFHFKPKDGGGIEGELEVMLEGKQFRTQGLGNGPIDAFLDAIKKALKLDFDVKDYFEHTLGLGSNANAASYVSLEIAGTPYLGVGQDSDSSKASFLALISSLNRYFLAQSNKV